MAEDVKSTVAIKVTADTAQARAEMDKLAEKPKKLKSAFEQMSDDIGKRLDSVIDGFGKVGLAINGVEKILGGLKKAFEFAEFSAQVKDLERNLPHGAMQRMTEATNGMVARTDLLRLGVKGLTGDFALSQHQMAEVLETAVALSAKGYGPASEIAERLNTALVKGVNRLDEFGIELEKTDNRFVDVNRAMEKFQAIQMSTKMDATTTALKQQATAWSDWADNAKEAMGGVVSWFMRTDREMSSAMGKAWDDIVTGQQNRYKRTEDKIAEKFGLRKRSGYLMSDEDNAAYKVMRDAEQARKREGVQAMMSSLQIGTEGGRLALLAGEEARQRRGGRSAGGDNGPVDYSAFQAGTLGAANPLGAFGSSGLFSAIGGGVDRLNQFTGSTLTSVRTEQEMQAQRSAMDQQRAGLAGGLGLGGAGDATLRQLESMTDLMDTLGDRTTAAGFAFQTFGGAVNTGLEALINGEKGAGKAMLGFIAQSLKGLAIESTTKSLYHLAAGIGASAFGSPTASQHFAASAKFAATAALAGVGAATLGSAAGGSSSGSGSPSSVPGGGFASSRGGSSGGDSSRPIIVQVGDGFFGRPRELGDEIQTAIRTAERSGRSSSSSRVVEGV